MLWPFQTGHSILSAEQQELLFTLCHNRPYDYPFMLAMEDETTATLVNMYLDRLRYYQESNKSIDAACSAPQSAIDEAARLVPASSDNPEFSLRTKSLVILLLRRFGQTAAVEDLQHAVLRAQELVAATPRGHPDRVARVDDWIDMMLVEVCLGGFRDEHLREVVEMGGQAGATVRCMIPGLGTHADRCPPTTLHMRRCEPRCVFTSQSRHCFAF